MTCPACRAPVTLSSSGEGTCCYVPQGPAERLDGERCGVCGARPRVEVAGSSGTWVQGEAGPEFVPEPRAREAWEDARRRGEG